MYIIMHTCAYTRTRIHTHTYITTILVESILFPSDSILNLLFENSHCSTPLLKVCIYVIRFHQKSPACGVKEPYT